MWLDVSPRLALPNVSNGGFAHSVTNSQGLPHLTRGSDSQDVGFSKFRARNVSPAPRGRAILSQPCVDGVQNVLAVGQVFEVFWTVVQFVSIHVVDFVLSWNRAEEGYRDHAMDGDSCPSPLDEWLQDQIAAPISASRQYCFTPSTDSSKRGGIVASESRNFRPEFFHAFSLTQGGM